MTVSELLEKAAKVLERDGFAQGLKAKGTWEETGPRCVSFAIGRALKEEKEWGTGLWSKALLKVRDVLNLPAVRLSEEEGQVIAWNDKLGRTKGEVVSALRQAAECARVEEQAAGQSV